jgi:hypothetical protein
MELILKNAMVEVHYDNERKLMTYEWHGLVNTNVGIETFKATMAFIRTHQCHFVLHDATLIKGTFTKMNDFMRTEVAPNFEKHGGLRSALVMSKDVFTIFAINQYLKMGKISIAETKLFSTRDQAMKWLEEKMGA